MRHDPLGEEDPQNTVVISELDETQPDSEMGAPIEDYQRTEDEQMQQDNEDYELEESK